MKKILLAATIMISLNSFASDPRVDEKVLDAFKKTFTEVTDVAWTEHENLYEVSFKQHDIQVKVSYDRDGNIINTLRYYQEEHLPLIVRSKIKTKYSDKKITGVTEMASEDGTFFYVILEGDKNLMEVKADIFGHLTVQKKWKKS
jgi:Protein of unknown function (DUF2874).